MSRDLNQPRAIATGSQRLCLPLVTFLAQQREPTRACSCLRFITDDWERKAWTSHMAWLRYPLRSPLKAEILSAVRLTPSFRPSLHRRERRGRVVAELAERSHSPQLYPLLLVQQPVHQVRDDRRRVHFYQPNPEQQVRQQRFTRDMAEFTQR